MKLSDYVIDFIGKQGVSHIFEMIGGAIAHLLDATYDREDMDCISVHHEQSAAFAAEGYARVNGKLGVAMATSGPGALNLLTGIGSCYFDSVPSLFITGQVNTYEYKGDRPVRQIGFQETDIVSIVRPIVKYAEMVTDPAQIRYQLEKAVFLAGHGRPGPVLLDLPMNVQRAEIEPDQLESFYGSSEHHALRVTPKPVSSRDIARTLELLGQASRPVILAGGGIRSADATAELRELVERTGIPVVHSLLGLDALPGTHPASAGLIGSYGNRYSNLTVANSDFLLILGSRLDTRQTGTLPESFAREAVKVHVDIDAAELNEKVRVDLAVHADVKSFLTRLLKALHDRQPKDYKPWHGVISNYKTRYPSGTPELASGAIEPNRFMELLSDRSAAGDLIVLDVGQHQMWASQSFRLREGQRLLNAGGMGAMGFALPAAIGAAKAAPGRRVIVIAGDGGIQVNIQELNTVARHGLPIKIFVMNNNNLGMVRQFQDMYFSGRRQSTVNSYSCPNLPAIAHAYGLKAFTIDDVSKAPEQIEAALRAEGSVLVEVKLALDTTVTPKLAVHHPVENMSPELAPGELESVMIIEAWKKPDRGGV
ncbi:thiamine pyrophosphate-binding protein [Paenibacillus sp. GCM10012307]|uniref:Thiamine pyrophosphate-binding protein n=1 Tax=Paenibacillus roseus TaxID=2798579 RepID=A0A934MRW1_9BACL|nr:thiamine pyrophosphate-binding protein [Paenibacillus roseus]MBJ6362724.1 thiamine pyrophosphate-binding protein [Paenibacillus roseus]